MTTTPQEMLALCVTWTVANWPTLVVLGSLLGALHRVGKAMDRQERDHNEHQKLMRLHELVHPNHAAILRNPEMTSKDIDADSVTPCDSRPPKR